MGSVLSSSSEQEGQERNSIDSQTLAAEFSALSLSGDRTSGNVTPERKQIPGQYEPSKADVFLVRHLLLHTPVSIPLEIIDIILNDAEYWPHISITRNTHLIASSQDGEWAYIVSPPIPRRPDNIPVKLKKVVFRTNSCDQGWGGSPEFANSYYGSWTWFEAGIMPAGSRLHTLDWVHERPVNLAHWAEEERHRLKIDKEERQKRREKRKIERKVAFDEGYDSNEESSESENDSDDDETKWPADNAPLFGRRWLVQRNIQVSREHRDHTVTWRHDDPVHDADVDEENGRGRGIDFLQMLQPGDKIVLLAKAQFPGWTNNVFSASIDFFFSVIV